MNGGASIRYVLVAPDGDITIRNGILTNKTVLSLLVSTKFAQMSYGDGECVMFLNADDSSAAVAKHRNPLIERATGDEHVYGPVIVTGPPDLMGLPTDIPTEAVWSLVAVRDGVEDPSEGDGR